jgi:hypothetical protein
VPGRKRPGLADGLAWMMMARRTAATACCSDASRAGRLPSEDAAPAERPTP